MSAQSILIMAQVDDASGELLGQVIRQLQAAGAINVQLASTLTKKGRPGYLLFIDLKSEEEDEIAEILAGELGVWGYRVLASQHKHFSISKERYTLILNRHNAGPFTFMISGKRIKRDGRLLKVKAEHDHLVAIQAALKTRGQMVPLTMLKAAVETAWWAEPDKKTIQIEV